MPESQQNNCPLCDRDLGNVWDNHHLKPKTFKGRDTVPLHKICHNIIHATFTERELQRYYHTIERLREHEDIQKFIKWVQTKPIDFYMKSKRANRRR